MQPNNEPNTQSEIPPPPVRLAVTVPVWDEIPEELSWKDKVALLAYALSRGPQAEVDPVKHMFVNGNYIREMKAPKGSLIAGREHRFGHEMQLLEGEALLIAPDGKFRFQAPATMHTKPGFYAVAYALTDIVVRTIHPDAEDCRDVAFLEDAWFGQAAPMLERGREIAKSIWPQLEGDSP